MKILKEGRKKTVKFKCTECGCEYAAETGEYRAQPLPCFEAGSGKVISSQTRYWCECPCCHWDNSHLGSVGL